MQFARRVNRTQSSYALRTVNLTKLAFAQMLKLVQALKDKLPLHRLLLIIRKNGIRICAEFDRCILRFHLSEIDLLNIIGQRCNHFR